MGDELIWEAIPKSKLAPWRNTIAKYIDVHICTSDCGFYICTLYLRTAKESLVGIRKLKMNLAHDRV